MNLSKEKIEQIYIEAKDYFNSVHPEWACTIEQGVLVIQLNWQNSTYFNGRGVSHVARVYRHVVKVFPNGKFMTIDVNTTDESSIGLGSIGISQESFAGKSWNYHYEKELGYDNATGETGILTYRFSTSDIQVPVRKYFENLGLKYNFYSFGEDIKAIPATTKISLGVLFLFIGTVFSVIEYCVLYIDPDRVLDVTINGVPQLVPVSEISLGVRIAFALFPAIFLFVGIFLIINFVKYNVNRDMY